MKFQSLKRSPEGGFFGGLCWNLETPGKNLCRKAVFVRSTDIPSKQ